MHSGHQTRQYVFLVGYPRSGTTLLQRMLDAHPALVVAPETFFMRHFWCRRHSYGSLDDDSNLDRLVQHLTSRPTFAEMGLDPVGFRRAVREGPRDYKTLFQLMLDMLAELHGVEVVGEKTPNHLLFMPTLQQFFPGARFVHIIRDPRAVVNSWRKVPWSSGSLSQDAEVWRRHLAIARRAAPRLDSALLTIRYENLITAPESCLRTVCTFLDLPFDTRMLTFHQNPARRVNIEREPWKHRAMRPIDAGTVDRWRQELSPLMIAEIEAVVRFEMQRWGYVPEMEHQVTRTIQHVIERFGRRIRDAISYRLQRLWARPPETVGKL